MACLENCISDFPNINFIHFTFNILFFIVITAYIHKHCFPHDEFYSRKEDYFNNSLKR